MKIGCVVVLYNPDIQALNNISKYPQLDQLILVDNSSKNNSNLFSSILLNKNVIYKPLLNNYGIAYALNLGIKSMNDDIEFVITMDQDSNLTNTIISTYRKYTLSHDNIYALTPQYKTDRNTITNIHGVEKVDLSMQSGSLFNIKLFKIIGYFNEKLFLDVVDWEYFLRMKKYGFDLIKCNEAILIHSPAKTESKKLIFKKIRYGVASPVRYYYQARNLLWVGRKYNSIKLYINLIVKFLKIIVLFKNKKRYLEYFNKGIQDARNNHLGKLGESN